MAYCNVAWKSRFLKLLVRHGADVRNRLLPEVTDLRPTGIRTALTMAAGENQLQILDYLLNQGLDVDSKELSGYTPLTVAIESGCVWAALRAPETLRRRRTQDGASSHRASFWYERSSGGGRFCLTSSRGRRTKQKPSSNRQIV